MTFGQRLDLGLFGKAGEPSYQHWERICAMRLDGKPIYETEIRRRTPSPRDTRFAEKLGEALLAAHAFARLDVVDVDIDTGGESPRESPDLRVTLDGMPIAVEIREVVPNAHAEHAAQDFNVELNERIAADETLRPAHTFLHISRAPGRHASGAMLPKTRERLMQSIIDYLRSGEYKQYVTEKLTCRHDWPGSSLGYHVWISRVPSPLGYVELDDQRGSFDSDAMIEPVLDGLEKKRKKAATYDRSLPLWLIVGVTEQWGIFTSSLQQLSQLTPDIDPFERVIVHDGMTYVNFPADAA